MKCSHRSHDVANTQGLLFIKLAEVKFLLLLIDLIELLLVLSDRAFNLDYVSFPAVEIEAEALQNPLCDLQFAIEQLNSLVNIIATILNI